MIDLETTGLRPDRNAILQLAAMAFDMDTGEVFKPHFDRCMTVPTWRHWCEDTRSWWLKQPQDILRGILSRGEDARLVMEEFVIWASKLDSPLFFWAKNASFDYQFVASYLADFRLPNPFHYRDVRDMKSFAWARTFPEPVPTIDEIKSAAAHNAVVDCLTQIDWLLKAYKATT